jgi:ribosomal protein L22
MKKKIEEIAETIEAYLLKNNIQMKLKEVTDLAKAIYEATKIKCINDVTCVHYLQYEKKGCGNCSKRLNGIGE